MDVMFVCFYQTFNLCAPTYSVYFSIKKALSQPSPHINGCIIYVWACLIAAAFSLCKSSFFKHFTFVATRKQIPPDYLHEDLLLNRSTGGGGGEGRGEGVGEEH